MVTAETGEPESDDSQRIRETLTAGGGYVFHGTRSTGLSWAYRVSGGSLKAVQDIGGLTSAKTPMCYQRTELGYRAEIANSLSDMIEQVRKA